jgi:thiol:disulfide interchange protein DsbD
MSIPRLLLVTSVFLGLPACTGGQGEGRDETPQEPGTIEVTLAPQLPSPETGLGMRWSPYGQKLPLTEVDGGLEASLTLGPTGTASIRLKLEKGPDAPHFDRLFIDVNRDGQFDATELLETTVTENNYKFWSSFDAVVDIPVKDPVTGAQALNPYPLSLWYVDDPRVDEEELVIRYSRKGWMEGSVRLGGSDAVVLVTENVMDGIFGPDDSWALAPRDSASDLYTPAYARSLDEHAWLSDVAYRVTEIDPSGRRLFLAPFYPGMTRAEEMEIEDYLAEDRRAPRSERVVAFSHDFEEAEGRAAREGLPLFVDFETTWCGPCKIMDEWVYTADQVVDASSSVVGVKVDGDERLDLKDRFGVVGFPTMILLDSKGEEIRRVSGYVNVAEMTEFLKPSG